MNQIRSWGMFNGVSNDLLLFAIKTHNNDRNKTVQWGMSFGNDYVNGFKKLKENNGNLSFSAATTASNKNVSIENMVNEIKSLGLFIDINDELIRLSIKGIRTKVAKVFASRESAEIFQKLVSIFWHLICGKLSHPVELILRSSNKCKVPRASEQSRRKIQEGLGSPNLKQ